MRHILSLSLVVGMFAVAAVAPAAEKNQGKPKPKVNRKSAGPPAVAKDVEKVFKDMDKDSNWRLNLDEFTAGKPNAAAAEKQFKAMDKDNDGYVSLFEFKTAMSKPDQPAEKKPTANKDGKKDAKKDPKQAPKKDAKKDAKKDPKKK